MEPERLQISGHWQRVIARGAHHPEEKIKHDQRYAGRQPASKEFAEHHLPASNRLGQQRKYGSTFAFEGNLSGCGGNGDNERENPNQCETNFLNEPDNMIVMEEIHSPHQAGDEHGQKEQDVEILATVEFFDDDGGNGKNLGHNL